MKSHTFDLKKISHYNRELSALYYEAPFLRTEVDWSLRDTEDFVAQQKSSLDNISKLIDKFISWLKDNEFPIHYANHVITPITKDVEYYVFHDITNEEECCISWLRHLMNETDIEWTPILKMQVNRNFIIITTIYEDLKASDIRFSEYLKRYPTKEDRSNLIEKQMPLAEY